MTLATVPASLNLIAQTTPLIDVRARLNLCKAVCLARLTYR